MIIAFPKNPKLNFQVREYNKDTQNLFNSGAEVIVNAANTQLFEGGGVDELVGIWGAVCLSSISLVLVCGPKGG